MRVGCSAETEEIVRVVAPLHLDQTFQVLAVIGAEMIGLCAIGEILEALRREGCMAA